MLINSRTFLIQGKNNSLIDINFCGDIPTYCHDGKRGLVVDKYNCIVYAGKKTEDKEWILDSIIT